MPAWLTVQNVFTGLGVLSTVCGVLGHLPLGKFSRVMGEIGIDLAGALQEVKAGTGSSPSKETQMQHITIPPKGNA